MGGFDIFRSERAENGGWSAPENLGYPINTPDDEVFYIMDKSGDYGYYSTIREGGLGSKDIYKVIFLGSEKELLTATKDQLVAGPGDREKRFSHPALASVSWILPLWLPAVYWIPSKEFTRFLQALRYMDPEGYIQEIRTVTNDSGVLCGQVT